MEVLIALTILGIAGVALLAGFATAITSSGEHRSFASLDSSTRLAANTAIADVQQQAQNAATDPFNCANSFTPSFPTLTGSFTVQATPAYWNGTTFQSSPCISYVPQQYTLVVSSTIAGHSYSTTVSTVIYDPGAPPSPSNVTAPAKLVWTQSPATGVAGISISPQPAVAIEDATNNIVSALSAVTLQWTGPGSLSNTCFGAPTYGIVQFSGCSFTKAGTYSVQAVSSGLTSTATATVVVSAAPAAKLVFTSAPVSATASNSAGSTVTVTEEDALGNPTTAAATVTLGTSSNGPSIFSGTRNGAALAAPPSVSIPAGQSSVTFFYGDQVAGSPTLTAGAAGLAPGSQVETINPGPASKLVFTSSAFTAPSNGAITTPFTVALEDQFNNVTSSTSSTKVTMSSTSANGKFAATSGGATTTFVTIAAGQPGSIQGFYGDTTVGTPTLTATGPTGSGLAAGTQKETVVAAPTKLVFTTAPVSGNAGTTATLGPITVQEQTAGGAATTVGETVNLTSNASGSYIFNTVSGASTPTGATSVTIPSGQSSVTFFYGGTKAATPTITAAATGLTSATQTETVNVGPVAAFALSNPGTQTAGNSFNETLTAQDAGGNTVSTFTGANCVTFSGPLNSPNGNAPTYPARGACPAGSSSVTFSNGVGTASVTLFDAQTGTALTATDGATVGSTASFTVNAGAASSFSLSSPSPVAGTSFTEAVSALDTYGNTSTAYTGTKCLAFSGPSNSPNHTAPSYPARGTCATGLSSVTFSAGVASVPMTLVDAQTTTLTATGGAVAGTSLPFTVASGPVSVLTVANPGPQVAGTAFNVTITATDTYGNIFNGTLIPTFSGPSNSPNGTAPSYPSSVAFTNGSASASITLFDAQSTTLRMASGGVNGTSTSFTVSAAPAAVLTATSGANQSANVTSAFTNKLVATATDGYGNPAAGLAVTFTAPNTGASASFASCGSNPQTYICTQTTSAAGAATSSTFTANGTNGTYTITASAGQLSATFVENNKGNQTISFTSTAPTTATVGGATYTPTASATSGLAVTITVDASSSSVCAINGSGVVSFTGAGTCKLDANQSGSAIWSAAPQVQQSITVAKANQTITFTSTAPTAATVGGATYTAAATGGGSGNPVTFSSGSTAVCTSGGTNGSVFTFVASGTCVVNANQLGNANYNAATQTQQSFAVKRNQTISFTSTAPTSAGVGGATYTPTATATSALTVAITVDSSSSSVCTIDGSGVVSFLGAGTCTLDANQAGNASWNPAAQVQQNITVKSNQTVSFTSTAPTTATVAGFTYTPTATATSALTVAITVDSSSSSVCTINGSGVVSFTGAGTCTLDANQAGNATWNPAPQVQQNITVAKANQIITFTSTPPAAATVGGATYTATATGGGSGNAVTFSSGSTTVCTSGGTNGSVFTFVGPGTCVVNANQTGNTNYNAATQVQQSFAVKANQTITFTSTTPTAATVGGATYTATATGGGSGNPVTFTSGSTAVCTSSGTNGSVFTFVASGTCVVNANQLGNANYNAATQAQQSFAVKANQAITFTSTPPTGETVGGATYTPSATATSALTVAITVDSSSSSVCTINGGGVVSFTGAGTCTLDANQAGNSSWNSAPQVQQSVTVGKANQTITFTSSAPTAATVGGATYTAAATGGGSGNAVTFSSGSTAVCTSGGTNGSVFTFVGPGTCVVNANQLGNTNYNAATQTQQSFAVKRNQTISFTSTAPSATVGGATYTPTATATSALTVAITVDSSSSSVCTINGGGVVSFTGAGTCTLDANQAGNASWNPAAQQQQNVTVGKGSQGITFTSNAPSATVGGATYTATATGGGSGNTVTFSSGSTTICTSGGTNGSVFTFVGIGNCVVNANQLGNANYNAAAQASQSVTVGKGSQTISFTSTVPSGATVGGTTYSATATGGGSGNTVTFSSGATTICTSGGTNGSVFTFVGSGTCVVNANQSGNANYNAATQAQQTFTVTALSVLSVNTTSTAQRKVDFVGTGANGGTTAVTVTVCDENASPCPTSGGHTVATVLTGTSPSNPWTTASTANKVLAADTQYFAQAKQGATSSAVFPFIYDANEPAPEDIALANGGVAKTADSGDTATVTFSEQLDASTICSTWNNSNVQTVSDATITFANGNPDSFTAASPTCGGGNFGTVSLGSSQYVSGSGTLSFTGSMIAWNPFNDTLTFTLGTQRTVGSVTVGTRVAVGTPGYTADPDMADLSGSQASTTPITGSATSGL
jgi:hypothetical protein